MIRFNPPYRTNKELNNIRDAINNGNLSGNGKYTKKCSNLLSTYLSNPAKVLITHSCTAALEMAAILLNIKPGDQIIMPSYTFVSTANAFVLRGGIPVFIDIRNDTLNIDETLIEGAITKKTKAIVVVHYAGVACEMDKILKIAKKNRLAVIEDAAQALGSSYKNKKLGTIGDIATFSFHETKNITSGEGGALVVNNSKFAKRAELIWEKGTNRNLFFKGKIDKYTWVDIGSSFLPSEIVSAFLLSQLQNIRQINKLRMNKWKIYKKLFSKLSKENLIETQNIPKNVSHNAHMFYILVKDSYQRDKILNKMKKNNISAIFHYIPLHNSFAGKKFGKIGSKMNVTNSIHNRIIRLPLYPKIQEKVIKKIFNISNNIINN
tara:strand:- start:30 stop:1163 length:1134 start_codon:yes stop_codon:yes gene_type:complete